MVPDKVLICSQAEESIAPRTLYSNHQMNNFFGRNLVFNDKEKNSLQRNAFNRKVFKEKQTDDFEDRLESDNLQPEMAMSLSDIVVRHHVQSKIDKQAQNINLNFIVDTPNCYENAEDTQKIVEINIIDILYDNKVRNLVYMRDITNYVK